MRIYEAVSTFRASAPIDIDALRALPGQTEARMICPGGPLRSALVRLVLANGSRKGAKARVFSNGTVVVTARNAEQVDAAAKRFASLLGTGPLRRDNKVPRVVKATAKVPGAVFASLLRSPPDACSCVYSPDRCAAFRMRMRAVRAVEDSAKIRMDASVYRSGAVVMTSRRSGEAPLTSKKLAAVFKDALKTIVGQA